MVFPQRVHVAQEAGFMLGAVCLIGDAFAFALYTNLSKRWMCMISPLVMTGGTMVSGASGLVLLSLLDLTNNCWSNIGHLDSNQWVAPLFRALICSVAAYFAYNFALTRIPASRAAVYIYYIEPVVAVLLGTILLNE